jgi:hypothetical protein
VPVLAFVTWTWTPSAAAFTRGVGMTTVDPSQSTCSTATALTGLAVARLDAVASVGPTEGDPEGDGEVVTAGVTVDPEQPRSPTARAAAAIGPARRRVRTSLGRRHRPVVTGAVRASGPTLPCSR